ncbi:ATP-binding protein [Candidatus Poribacteria bacterium]
MDNDRYIVLIVDDEEIVTESINTLLTLETDYNTLILHSPSEALNMLQSQEIDLVISDYLMPGDMNGVEFLLKVKAQQPEAIRVLLTAYADKENAIRAINEVELYQYIEKPWDNEALLLLLRNGLAYGRLRKHLAAKTSELNIAVESQERLEVEILRAFEQLENEIAERKRSQELAQMRHQQLMQADKMATLGILSSGIAHEINNPNNFILLNARIFSRAWNDVMPILQEYFDEHGDFALAGMPYTQSHERIGQLISGMSEGAQRIQKIVQGLKDFARQDTGELDQLVDINSVIEAAILIAGNLIKKCTECFTYEYGDNLPKIRGNVQQLEQVIINLITNSCQALQDRQKSAYISTSYNKEADSIIVKVRDEGMGISPKDLGHIMDPFFTTKRSSGGTGLGLSISYSIVKAHGGDLEFTSEVGKGTTAVLSLPVHREAKNEAS